MSQAEAFQIISDLHDPHDFIEKDSICESLIYFECILRVSGHFHVVVWWRVSPLPIHHILKETHLGETLLLNIFVTQSRHIIAI